MNGCNEYRELISCRLDGELDAADVSSLEKHLEGCPSCRSYYELLSAVLGAEAKVEPPPALLAGVMEGIKTAPRPKRNVLRPVITVAAAAACLAIVIAAVGIPKFTERQDAVMSGGTAPAQFTLGASAPLELPAAGDTYSVRAAAGESADEGGVSFNTITESAPQQESAAEEAVPKEAVQEKPDANASAPDPSPSRNTAPGNTAPEKPAAPPAPAEQEPGPIEEPPAVKNVAGGEAPTEAVSSDPAAPESPSDIGTSGPAAPESPADIDPSGAAAPESPSANDTLAGGEVVNGTPEETVTEIENAAGEPENDSAPSADSYRATVRISGDLPDVLSGYEMTELDDGDNDPSEPDDSDYGIVAPADVLSDLEDMDYDIEYQDEQSDLIYILYSPD